MKIWLPEPLYKLKPWFLLYLGIMLVLLSSENLFVIISAIILFCHSVYIFVQRFRWKNTTHLDLFPDDKKDDEGEDKS